MRTFIILCFLLITTWGVKSQEITVFYKEKRKANYHKLRSYEGEYGKTKEDIELIKEKAKTHEKELSEYRYTSVLRIEGVRSLYYPQENIYNDTINSRVTYGVDQQTNFISRETSEKEYKIVYMDLDTKTKISTEYTYGKEYLIEEDIPPIHWKITDQTQKMFGYDCKKAILQPRDDQEGGFCSRNPLEVWYTETIKTASGPLGYWGLPGLIVMVKDHKKHIVLDKVLFDTQGIVVQPPTQGEKITRVALEEIPILLFNEH